LVDRKRLIEELDSLVKECTETAGKLLDYQRLKQNDARVTFFKHFNTVLDPAVISLILAHKYLGNESWWNDIHSEYRLSRRPYDYDREFNYFDQIIMNGTFLLIFDTFEASIRLICEGYNNTLFQQQRNFSPLCKGIIKDLNLVKRDDFIDLITYLRNSFHNNGRFVPRGPMKNRKIIWNNTIYTFNANQPIKDSKSDLWLSLVPISREIITIFNEVINSTPVKNIGYYPDRTEPIK
jgi:hypothetical protein